MREKTIKHVPGVISTSFLYLDQTMKNLRLILGLITVSTSASLLRHGDNVKRIWFRFNEIETGGLITYEEDGAGIPAQEKDLIFRRGFGKHRGLGLFLSREILAITGITIRENGETGKGVKFEILIPRDMYRVIQ